MNKKIASLENFSKKNMSSGPIMYYDGYGRYDFPKKFHPTKPIKKVETK